MNFKFYLFLYQQTIGLSNILHSSIFFMARVSCVNNDIIFRLVQSCTCVQLRMLHHYGILVKLVKCIYVLIIHDTRVMRPSIIWYTFSEDECLRCFFFFWDGGMWIRISYSFVRLADYSSAFLPIWPNTQLVEQNIHRNRSGMRISLYEILVFKNAFLTLPLCPFLTAFTHFIRFIHTIYIRRAITHFPHKVIQYLT